MTPVSRTIAAIRKLCRLHNDTGMVLVVELELLIAELETAEDERPSTWSDPAGRGRSGLDTTPYGYPRGLESL